MIHTCESGFLIGSLFLQLVISQEIYFSDICQAEGPFYVCNIKINCSTLIISHLNRPKNEWTICTSSAFTQNLSTWSLTKQKINKWINMSSSITAASPGENQYKHANQQARWAPTNTFAHADPKLSVQILTSDITTLCFISLLSLPDMGIIHHLLSHALPLLNEFKSN